MNEYGPARGAPPDFNECEYCHKRFATGAARSSHEATSNFSISQQVMGMLSMRTNNGGHDHEAKKQKQGEPAKQDEPADDGWEDFGGDTGTRKKRRRNSLSKRA